MHRLAETALTTRIDEGWTVVALFLILVVGIIDYLTGPEITFAVFYLIPVAFAAWISGTKGAVGASALAALAWLLAEIGSSRIGNAAFVYAWNFCVRLLFLLMVALLLARLHEMLRRERTLSRSDALTGLLNARAFRQIAESEIARAHRYGQALSLAFIDIDDFKRVNDRAGHAAGDQLIQQIADTLRSELRASDIVARYGGESSWCCCPSPTKRRYAP
jgi:predicted signal transduction protein with EAL and GGDEF domain